MPSHNFILEFDMSELISPLRSQDNIAVLDGLQAHLRKMVTVRQADAVSSSAVKMRAQPSPEMLDEAEAATRVNQMQAEAQRGMDVALAHNGLDPQRVAKLLGLLDEV